MVVWGFELSLLVSGRKFAHDDGASVKQTRAELLLPVCLSRKCLGGRGERRRPRRRRSETKKRRKMMEAQKK